MTLLKKCISSTVADCKNLLRLLLPPFVRFADISPAGGIFPKPRSKFQIASESCAILQIAFEG